MIRVDPTSVPELTMILCRKMETGLPHLVPETASKFVAFNNLTDN